jgi:hypothetical protein
MIKLLILNIINKFIPNIIQLNSNGLYSFKSDKKSSDYKIKAKSNLTCLKILEETLKEMNYLKADAKITRDEIYKIIVEIENISSESIILLMAFLKNTEQSNNDIDKLNNLLISNFHTNDIDFFLSILLNLLEIKSCNINDLASSLTNFKSMLCFLTNTPYEIDTSVGIYNDTLVDNNINFVKTYKIKYKKNSLDLNSSRKDKCFDSFYVDPDINPIRVTKPANVFLKEGWERKLLKQLEIKGVIKKTANWIYNDLMYIVGKSKDTEEVYFKNEPMCQRRWTNDEIQNDDKWDAEYDEEEYIDEGEDVFNLYDPEVTDETDPNSDLYKNNEILKKIWFYSDDLFPVQPHKSPIYNYLDRRAEFAFKTLQVQNKDIFKSSLFKKEDLHIILPILWLYKIHDEYQSIVSNTQTDNNIELLFNYFKPDDLLLYFKKHILLENNTFDLETLSFIIILGALSKMTSLLIDDRVIKKNIEDFEPKNFNLFGRLGVHEIKELIQNHPKKSASYVNYLNIIIERYIFDDDLRVKIEEEYETRNDEIRQYYIRNVLNIMQITGSSSFISLFNYGNYQYKIKTGNDEIETQLLEIDNSIGELISPQLLLESGTTAEPNQQANLLIDGLSSNPVSIMTNGTSITQLSPIYNGTNNFNNQLVPMDVHLAIASNLVQYISGNKSIKGMNVTNAMKALNLIRYKSSVISNDNSVKILNITPSNIHDSSLNIDPEVTGLLGHLRNSTGSSVTASNSEIVQLLFQTGELFHNYSIALESEETRLEWYEQEFKTSSEKGYDVDYEISMIAKIKQDILLLEKEFIQQKHDLQSKLTSISEHVPLDPNIVSVKVLSHLHGTEKNLNKRTIINCGKFKYIGLIGEAGRVTSFQVGDEYNDKVFNGIPSATNIPQPLSEYCEVPIIQFELHDDILDNNFGGILVEIQHKNGTIERKNIATNQQLSKIFEKNRHRQSTDAFDLPSFLPVLEQILRLNGLDPSVSSVVFDSCRGLGINYPLKKTAQYIFEELAINAEICQVDFNPQVAVEFIPDEVKRVNLKPNQYVGEVISIEPRLFFDPNNPRKYAGHNLKLRFGIEQGKDEQLCWQDNPEIGIHYSFLMAFNAYLKKNPSLLTTFNRLSPERRQKLFTDLIVHPDYVPIMLDPIHDEKEIEMKYKDANIQSIEVLKQINKEIWYRNTDFEPYFDQVFHEHFFPPQKGERFMEIHMGTPTTPFPDMNLLLRQHIRKLNKEQFRENHPHIGFLAGILAGGYNKNKLNGGYPEKNIDLNKLFEEAQHFHFNTYITEIKNIYFEDISVLDNINKLHINNVFKTIKIQIEKIKIYIRITLKKKIDEDYYKFIYSYFYEVIYRYLLMILNEYKNEMTQLFDKLTKAKEYFDLFEKKCIKEDYLDFKMQKMNKSDIDDKKKILIKDYDDALKTLDNTHSDIKPSTNIISILQNLQYEQPIFKTILEKHKDLIDDLIVNRWANYIILYDISLTSCDLKAEIEKIEFELLMEISININILEPLTLFIPNYNELIKVKYDFYMDKSLSLIRDQNYDRFIDCDFVKNYYRLIYNKIQNIQNNIFEIRKTNNDINEFFNVRKIKNLNNPMALPAKNNINVYSEQLSYYLNNVDEIFNILHDDVSIENDIQPIEIKSSNENTVLWLAENTPNTVENKLLLLREEFNKHYQAVKMNDLILNLII